jgi:hypothetical protein
MVARNTVHERAGLHPGGTKCAYLLLDGATTQSQKQVTEKLIKDRFHFPVRADKKTLAKNMVKDMQKSPLGRLITAIATTPQFQPEKTDQGKKILRHSDSELKEKLIQTMERVLEKLSYTG